MESRSLNPYFLVSKQTMWPSTMNRRRTSDLSFLQGLILLVWGSFEHLNLANPWLIDDDSLLDSSGCLVGEIELICEDVITAITREE